MPMSKISLIGQKQAIICDANTLDYKLTVFFSHLSNLHMTQMTCLKTLIIVNILYTYFLTFHFQRHIGNILQSLELCN